MTDAAISTGNRQSGLFSRPEHMAWFILLLSFGIFCLICTVSTLSLYYFLFQSTVSLQTVLQPGRGSLEIQDRSGAQRTVRASFGLSSGMTARTADPTDTLSQGVIFFHDTSGEGELIATVVMMGDTSLNLRSASRPRFRWTLANYQISLTSVIGELEVTISDQVSRDFVVNISTLSGARISLRNAGHYALLATDTHVRLTNWRGEAILFAAAGLQHNRSIPAGYQGITTPDETEITVVPAFVNLVRNGTFQRFTPVAAEIASGEIIPFTPEFWSCANNPNNLPRGSYEESVSPDGQRALRFVRREGATDHGWSRCEQTFGEPNIGTDVSGYNSLLVRVKLYIDYQSLSNCGNEASECPLMILLDFIGDDGVPRQWYHGIYARRDPALDNPLRCASCFEDHLLIYEDSWYIYESRNLFQFFQQPGARPRAITKLTIYASGHQYDVYVGEVELLAGSAQTIQSEGTDTNAGGG